MMKELLLAPLFFTVFLGFALELNEIAKDTSAQTLVFADDMRNALPCATKGIPITECSPNLANPDFEDEMQHTLDVLERMQNETIRTRVQERLTQKT